MTTIISNLNSTNTASIFSAPPNPPTTVLAVRLSTTLISHSSTKIRKKQTHIQISSHRSLQLSFCFKFCEMSGAVGPSNDISLHKEESHESDGGSAAVGTTGRPPRRPGFFTFRQLNALAVVVVLSASGVVSIEDFAFVLFSIIYMYFISKIAFPPSSPTAEPPVFWPKNRILGIYVFVGAVIGLYLPIAYIFEGIFEGDKAGIKAAAPHVFLLSSQVFMEGISFSGGFSLPIRVFVPVFYNSKRIFTIVEWLRSEIYKVESDYGGSLRRLHIGRLLAVANMAFWSFNLFGFLLPVFLPKAFKIYYANRKIKD